MQGLGDIQAVEQNRGVGLRGVAALIADDAFEFTQAHAVFVRESIGIFRIEDLALRERGPQPRVAHDDGVDHAEGVEGELILAQHAHFLGPRDGTLGGLDLAGEDLHEGGLAGAVRPGDGIAPAGQKGGGHILKQDAGAVAHGNVVDG